MTRAPGRDAGGRDLRVAGDAAALAGEAAAFIARRGAAAAAASGRFTLVLAGGSTPRAVYRLLALDPALRATVPWDRTHLFQGDERHVPPDHPESNWRMARETLIGPLAAAGLLPEGNLHRIEAENPDAAAAARNYESLLRAFFGLRGDELPRFDLVLLGMGPDGHTASLFPGTSALGETERLVAAPFVPRFASHRITLTFPVLDAAACVLFVVAGADKAPALRRVLSPSSAQAGEPLPAARVRPRDGELVWMADVAAAAPPVLLEPLRPEHAGEMFEALQDARIYEFIEERPPDSVEALRDRYRRLATGRSPDGSQAWLNWVIREADTRRCAGYVQATIESDGTAWFAYVLSPAFQGRGLATAACREAIARLRDEEGVENLRASVDPRNVRSIRLLERLGFRDDSAGTERGPAATASDRVFRLGGSS